MKPVAKGRHSLKAAFGMRVSVAALALGFAVSGGGVSYGFEVDKDLSGFFVGVAGYVDTSEIGTHDFQFGGDAETHLDVSMLFDNGVESGLHLEGGIEGGTQHVQQPEGEVVEQAYIYVDSFFGKVHVGRIDGIGANFSYTAPGLFYGSSVNDRETDLSRINPINTVNTVRNGFDDYSVKLEYHTPRVLGVKAGMSYAPKASNCESDYCNPSSFFDGSRDYENVFEIGLDYLQSYSNGLSIGVSASYLRSDVKDSSPFVDDLSSYAVGANMSLGGFTIGGSFKGSKLGDKRGDYLAYDVGATYERGAWGFMLAYGADDSDVGLATIGLIGSSLPQSTSAFQGGVDYSFKNFVSVGGGVQYVQADRPGDVNDDDATVVFLETMFNF